MSDGRARFLLVVGAALFSTGGAAVKSCGLDGWQVASFRSGVAALALVAALPAARRGIRPRTFLVGIAYAATLTLFVLANKRTTAANAIFLQSTAPLYLLVLGPLLLHERIGRRELTLLAAVAAGLALCFVDSYDPTASATDPALGNALGVAAGAAWACTLLGLRWAGSGEDANNVSCVAVGNGLAFAACLPFALPVGAVATADVLVLLWLGVFQIGAAYVCVTAGLRRVPVFEASLILLAEPVLNPVWAWLVHDERPGAWTMAAGVLILGASLAHALRPAEASG
ncbi:MAG: DMT family transporter [Planctomycetota bacterium]